MTIVDNTKIGSCVQKPILLTLPVTHGFSAYTLFPVVNLLHWDTWNSNWLLI